MICPAACGAIAAAANKTSIDEAFRCITASLKKAAAHQQGAALLGPL
jgi:hypothetical protein